MHKNEKIKSLLEQALRLQFDYSLNPAKHHIVAALRIINEFESRKARQVENERLTEKLKRERDEALKAGLPYNQLWKLNTRLAKDAIKNIDKMIDEELGKIDREKGNDDISILHN